MLRKTAVILAILLSSVASQIYALGLGTVSVESALNQPLRVRIEILDLGDTRLDDVTVSMASVDDFQRFNIDRSAFLNNVRFQVVADPTGNFLILTTNQVVREPFLSFVLDTRWPSGRLLSEHTVLLDLPVFDGAPDATEITPPVSRVVEEPEVPEPAVVSEPAPVVVPVVEPEVVVEEEPAPVEEPEPAPEPVVVEEIEEEEEVEAIEAGAAREIPDSIEVQPNDTLTEIALRVRPDSSVSLQQTMIAIQQMNPDAFAGGNINRLRVGQVLRVPSLADIQAVDPRQAIDEIARQNQEIGFQPLAAQADADDDGIAPAQGQLSVVSDADGDAAGGASNDELDRRIAELETQLAVQQEEADRARLQREELETRMAELNEQIAAAQEVIRLQDIQLAQLQDSLAEAAAEAQAQAAAEQAAALAAAQAAAAAEANAPRGLLSTLTGNPLVVMGGGALIVLLLVLALLRRNRAAKLDDEDMDGAGLDDFEGNDLDSELDSIIGDRSSTAFGGAADERQPAEESDTGSRAAPMSSSFDNDDTASFLDDLGIDLDEFEDDDDEPAPEAAVDSMADEPDVDILADEDEPAAEDSTEFDIDIEDDSAEADDLELPEDEAPVEIDAEEDTETFEFSLDADTEKEVPEAKQGAEPEIELEAFDFDLEDTAVTPAEPAQEPEPAQINDDGGIDFDMGDDDVAEPATDEPEKDGEEVETFDFNLDDYSADTVIEKPVESKESDDSAADSDEESITLDLDDDLDDADDASDSEEIDLALDMDDDDTDVGVEFDLGDDASEESAPDEPERDDEGFLEIGGGSEDTPEIEFEIDNEPTSAASDSSSEELNDLEFLGDDASTDDDMEIEAIDFEEISSLSDDDEAATKLELAYAYRKMGDAEGAKEILQEVIKEGNEAQVNEAEELLTKLDSSDD